MTDQYEWNPPERLPPVGCPLVIRYTPGGEGAVMLVERISHLMHRDGDMDYLVSTGQVLTGRFFWSYP